LLFLRFFLKKSTRLDENHKAKPMKDLSHVVIESDRWIPEARRAMKIGSSSRKNGPSQHLEFLYWQKPSYIDIVNHPMCVLMEYRNPF